MLNSGGHVLRSISRAVNWQAAPAQRVAASVGRMAENRVGSALLVSALAFAASACGDNETVPPERTPYTGGAPAPLECVPNLDGKIEASEVAPAIGISVSYLVSPFGVERTVNLAGAQGGSGTVWDFSTDFADDQEARIKPSAIAGKWYEGSFPPDAFVTPFDAGGSLENIGLHTDSALLLLGLASRDENPAEGKTLVVYDPPVEVLRFPIQPGTKYASVGQVKNGMIRGLPYAGKDTYEVEVDELGSVVLPALIFKQAHRVRTRVTVEPAVGNATSQRQVSFFTECFAEVVRVTSNTGEAAADFTTAAEVRRIGF